MSHEHEHEHEHDHEYMHAHGIPHDHGAEQPHAHDHAHPHACDDAHGCPGAGDCARCDADPRAEVAALMRYMVNHNAAHAGELAQLAGKLKDLGDTTAYEQVMLAVSDFEKGNMRLSTVLAAMNPPA